MRVIGIAAILLPVSLGCSATSDRLSVTELSTPHQIEAHAHRFWSVHDVPKRTAPTNPRVAIVEFTVEYVPTAAPPADVTSDGELDFATGLKLQLPNVLYQIFTDLLTEFDREAVPVEDVCQSEPYLELAGMTSNEVLALATQESGTAAVRYPVETLICLDPTAPDMQAKLQELVRSVNAAGALQVQLRTGVHLGRATIEPGSRLVVTTPEGSGYLESQLALVSERTVVKDVFARELAIDSAAFAREMKTLFRPCLAMALEVTRSAETP